MQKRKDPALSSEMLKAQEKFKHWRKTRKKRTPIPEELWQVAISLSPKYSINQISKGLILSHTDLKNRINSSSGNSKSASSFIEVDLSLPVSQISECVVELTDGKGAHMKMLFKGDASIDLLELGKTFLGKSR